MPPGIWEKLPMYKDWGFAVFKLRAGKETYHPMAFSFERRFPTRLFFPAVHVHDGQVHPYAQFDHMLYCQPNEKGLNVGGWTESEGPVLRYLKISKTQGIADGLWHCYRTPIKGRQQNTDHVLISG